MNNIIVSNISKSYSTKNGPKRVVKAVSFEIKPGEIFGLLGINGAGKTSTIKMVSGITLPDTGTVEVFGKNPSYCKTQKLIGTILEGNRNLYWRMNTQENLTYFGVLKGMSVRAAKTRAVELVDKFDFADNNKTLVQDLSRGMQQKLAIIVALMHRPRFLVLDEPTLGLDILVRDVFCRFIKEIASELGVCILLTSHDLEFVSRTASKFGIMRHGEITTCGEMNRLSDLAEECGYRIRLSDSLCGDTKKQLTDIGVTISDAGLIVGQKLLYEALDIIRPASIRQVVSLSSSLEDLIMNAQEVKQ